MAERSEDLNSEDRTNDGLSPEEYNFHQARKLFIAAVLTPVYWIVLFFLIATVAEWKGVAGVDSAFVSILWGVFALVYTGAVTYGGVQQGRAIRGLKAQKGLRYARAAVIVGALFTVASAILAVTLITG